MIMHYKFNAKPEDDFNPKLRKQTLDFIVGDTLSMGRLIKTSKEVLYDLKAIKYERDYSLKHVNRIMETASKIIREAKPRLFFFTISADAISHISGRNSSLVKKFLKEVDKNIPQLVEALDETYGKRRYVLIVFSDHGIANVRKHLDLTSLLSDYGFKPASPEILFSDRTVNAAALSNGRRMGLLYIAHPEHGWTMRLTYEKLRNYKLGAQTVDIPKLLAGEKGIKQVFVRKDDRSVAVVSEDGESIIEYNPRNKKYRYRVIKGEDPLEYNIKSDWLTEEEALKITLESKYPDAIVQVFNLFKSENCGDLVVNASEGWDFWEPYDIPYKTLKASHGGLSREEMKVFILIKGPRIKGLKTTYARLLDIFAIVTSYYKAEKIAQKTHAINRLILN